MGVVSEHISSLFFSFIHCRRLGVLLMWTDPFSSASVYWVPEYQCWILSFCSDIMFVCSTFRLPMGFLFIYIFTAKNFLLSLAHQQLHILLAFIIATRTCPLVFLSSLLDTVWSCGVIFHITFTLSWLWISIWFSWQNTGGGCISFSSESYLVWSLVYNLPVMDEWMTLLEMYTPNGIAQSFLGMRKLLHATR